MYNFRTLWDRQYLKKSIPFFIFLLIYSKSLTRFGNFWTTKEQYWLDNGIKVLKL